MDIYRYKYIFIYTNIEKYKKTDAPVYLLAI